MLFHIDPLRLWVHKVLPVVYDDSLSYYEVLAKVTKKLNEVIDLTEEQNQYIEEFSTNLTNAINNWEDGMEREWSSYKSALNNEWGAFQRNTEQYIENWKNMAESDIEDAIAAGINQFVGYFSDLTQTAVDAAERAMEAAETAAEDAVDAVMPSLESQFDERYAWKTAVGSPLVATTAAGMTDTTKVYVYAGSESGYVNGDWYYYDGTAWQDGGVYNSAAVVTDPTLSESGVPADAKAAGDEIADLKSAIDDKIDKPSIADENKTPRATNDGEVEWVEIGLPTDEQTADAVSAWLDDHPEATTTVQDGSLTEAKFTDTLKLKTIKDYVTPEMFGAVGDGVTDDRTAFVDMFSYVNDNQINIDNNNYECITIVLSKAKYYIGSTITLNNGYKKLRIIGNGAWIINNWLSFGSNGGWKFYIENVSFNNITNVFNFDTLNLEYGDYIFDHCQFISCGTPFIMNRRSCMVHIRNCYFRSVQRIGEFTNVDRLYFYNNWVSLSSTISGDYVSFLKQNAAAEGAMFVFNNLFVPQGGANMAEPCWIEVNEHARIYNNRFGGENAYIHPLRIGSGFAPKGSTADVKHPYVSFDHNDEVSGATSIILEKIAGNMLFEANQGWISGGKIIEWSNKTTAEDQATLITAQANMLNLVIKDNVGRTFYRGRTDNAVPDAYLPSCPENLYPVINRGLRNLVRYGGSSRPYLTATARYASHAVDLVVHGNPYIDGTSKFVDAQFGILVWYSIGNTGNYDANYHYGLITFGMSGTTVTPYFKQIDGSESTLSSITIDGNATIAYDTLKTLTTFTLTLTATGGSTNAIKRLNAKVVDMRSELSLFA